MLWLLQLTQFKNIFKFNNTDIADLKMATISPTVQRLLVLGAFISSCSAGRLFYAHSIYKQGGNIYKNLLISVRTKCESFLRYARGRGVFTIEPFGPVSPCLGRTPVLTVCSAAPCFPIRRESTPTPNTAVIDHRLRPRCCHPGSYFKRSKSSPVRPLACNWYCCAMIIAKPKAAYVLRFSRTATSSNLGL